MNKSSRRARAIAIADTKNATAYLSLKIFVLAACATAAFVALPSIQIF